MHNKHNTGFTIVELTIGMLAGAILALTAGIVLSTAYRGWVRGLAQADMERDASVALHTLALVVRGGEASNAVVGIDALRIRMPSNGPTRAFYVQTSGTPPRRSLMYNPDWPGGAPMTVIHNRLETFSSGLTGKLVTVTMSLSSIDQNGQDAMTGMVISNLAILVRN